eukprot:TRINITY_DN7953_c0_g1_i1.p1 TRINITY_DN7953_c0_g1~~TRINITY_DN7953_c0_g1_i1.p1  ORF type:complete len:433 (-),score=37.80 TRINITY_DN7953_c0_g1_i1:19-1317(-)
MEARATGQTNHRNPSNFFSSWSFFPVDETVRSSKMMTLFTVGFGLFVDLFVYWTFVPIAPFIVASVTNPSLENMVLLMASYALGHFIANIILLLFERVDRRDFFQWALVLLLISNFLYIVATKYWELLIARFLHGAAAGLTWSIGLAIVKGLCPQEQLNSAQPVMMVVYYLGQVLGPPIGGLLYEKFGRTAPFLLCQGALLLDVFFRLFIPLPDNLGLPKKAFFIRTFANLRFIGICLGSGINGAVSVGLEVALPLYLAMYSGMNIGPKQMGTLMLALVLPIFLSSVPILVVVKRFGNKTISVMSSTLIYLSILVCGYIWQHFNVGIAFYYVVFSLFGVVTQGMMIPLLVEMGHLLEENSRRENLSGFSFSIRYSFFHGILNLFFVVGILFFGWVLKFPNWLWTSIFSFQIFFVFALIVFTSFNNIAFPLSQ